MSANREKAEDKKKRVRVRYKTKQKNRRIRNGNYYGEKRSGKQVYSKINGKPVMSASILNSIYFKIVFDDWSTGSLRSDKFSSDFVK